MHYRRIMEERIGRKLETHEHVHHKDGDHFNDALENLQLCPTPRDHFREHAWHPEELIRWLIQFADEVGHFPTSKECNDHPGMPHSSTFRRHFGSWSAALQAAKNENDMINEWHGGTYHDYDDGL